MPDASSPLNEDNVAEALQGIKDARQSTERAWLLGVSSSRSAILSSSQNLKRKPISFRCLPCGWTPVQRLVYNNIDRGQ